MDDLDRASQKWGGDRLSHMPIHPHLSPDDKTFLEKLKTGSIFEELLQPRLRDLFRVVDAYCDRLTTDTQGAERRKGKRIWMEGKFYVAPDFAVSNDPAHRYFVDIKSKQYHSFYHKTQQIQQCVDVQKIQDYLAISQAHGQEVFLLFHLWPATFMKAMGQGQTARIHTGVKWETLPEASLRRLLLAYPVDDWYYLINAARIPALSHVAYDASIRGAAYFFPLRYAIKGPGKGLLPPLDAWYAEATRG